MFNFEEKDSLSDEREKGSFGKQRSVCIAKRTAKAIVPSNDEEKTNEAQNA